MKGNISQELTPMVATARTIKKQHPDAQVVLSGPVRLKNWRLPGPMCEAMWTL